MPVKSRLSGLRLCFWMYVCSLVVSVSVIFIGGRALHPLVMRAVMVCWSGCMFFAWSPFSPCISTGLSPVWALMSSFNESGLCAEDISIKICSLVGGWIDMSSLVYLGRFQWSFLNVRYAL